MNAEVKTQFDLFNEISFLEQTEDEDFDCGFDDIDLDLSDASDSKTVLD